MARPVSVSIPHSIGKEEAKQRLREGFTKVQQQIAAGAVSFQEHWEEDQMHFEGGVLGQKITGRLHVLPSSVEIQVDLPMILAMIADRITGTLKKETQKLLEKK